MKHLAAALAIAALLAPSITYAATPAVRIIETTEVKPAKPKIVSFEAANGEGEQLSWETTGDARLELAVRCKAKARLRVEHEDGVVTYVQCNGRTQVAYRSAAVSNDSSDVSLSVTGDRVVKVQATLKAFASTGRLVKVRDVARLNVEVAPEADETSDE
jgi:hypothetical protein